MNKFEITFEDNSRCITNICKFGAYGDIYVDKENSMAYKIFRAKTEDKYEEFISKQSFESEVLAQEIVQKNDSARIHAPKFYGRRKILKALHPHKDITNAYFCECCYAMEYLPCIFTKNSNASEFSEIIKQFYAIGVRYTEDSDVCMIDGKPKFIDIGIMGVREKVDELCNSNRANFNGKIAELVSNELQQLSCAE